MRFADLVSTAMRRCRARPLESILIVLGIALGVAVVAAFTGLIGTAGAQIRTFAESLEAREITIRPESGQAYDGFSADVPAVAVARMEGSPYSLTLSDVERIKSRVSPDVKVYAHQDLVAQLTLQSDAPASARPEAEAVSRLVRVIGATEDIFLAYSADFAEGIGFSNSDVASGARCIVLGSKLATRTFGDEPALGNKLVWQDGQQLGPAGKLGPSSTGRIYTVIGVMTPIRSPLPTGMEGTPEDDDPGHLDYSLDGSAFVPITSAPGMDGPNPRIAGIHGVSLSSRSAAQALDQIRHVVEAEYGGRLQVTSIMDYMKEGLRELRSLATGILVLTSTGLIIASINVLNLMLARVLRRTRAIGISAALGAGRRDVFRESLAEALALGICGGMLGLPLSFVLAKLMSRITQGLTVSVGLTGVLAGTASCIAASVLFGLYPAYLAARVIPADALRGD